jgi:hypothetical protein
MDKGNKKNEIRLCDHYTRLENEAKERLFISGSTNPIHTHVSHLSEPIH